MIDQLLLKQLRNLLGKQFWNCLYCIKRASSHKGVFSFLDFYVSAVNRFSQSRDSLRYMNEIFLQILSMRKFQQNSCPQPGRPLYFFPELSKEWNVTLKSDKMLLYN
ncbi:hypothetical protein A2W48_02980 [Candidatus Giovannonibacteria bacterium RIFCSPHIGHO2_12_44_12]|uniref:Uncharacterized protein n=1 Tax=Candidatus Giovannonibacteria bacterium RIFCSPHIGHO2_12_44_12 TaxID=1798340 RepID=A0A1F5WXT0_9BACT|nr:MAG: hypothetical protein A2W48_02980 [Candidatus Giovannonibacteria bacterium RIFCSPHIGHO2_12_44_12]